MQESGVLCKIEKHRLDYVTYVVTIVYHGHVVAVSIYRDGLNCPLNCIGKKLNISLKTVQNLSILCNISFYDNRFNMS